MFEKKFQNILKKLAKLILGRLQRLKTFSTTTDLDKNRVQMTAYLNDAIYNVMESYVGRFFELVKDSAQVLERVDSIVASMKNGEK